MSASLIVQKFGGTSVGSVERIQCVADKVASTYQQGNSVVVVLSAMSGETDRLINLAQSIHHDPDPREYAMLVTTGEQVSISLLVMALIARGLKARSYTGRQAGILTDNDFKKARILDVKASLIQSDLDDGYIVIVAGFQGINGDGEVTTLGRGGSDTTAVALAAVLEAQECQIYTDVDGVYTADPRVVRHAKRLDRVTFEEMLELASLGAKVLQIRAVEFAGKYNVPLRVLSSFKEGEGTLITFEDDKMEKPVVSGIAYNRNEAKITVRGVPNIPGMAAKIIGPVSAANIDIDMIVQNVGEGDLTDFSFTVHRDEFKKANQLVRQLASDIQARDVVGDNTIAKLSLVGVGMRSHSGIADTMFKTLAQEGINIEVISTSEIKVSVIVAEKYLELGVRALHTAFGLDGEPIEEFDPLCA